MSKIIYKIFSESLQHPQYILKDSAGNQLEFFRDNWADCKLVKSGKDLVKIDVIEYDPLTIALNFTSESILNNIVFSRYSSFSFKVKGNYHSNEVKEINWKWKVWSFWSTTFTLVDKNNGKELAKIEEYEMGSNISGSLVISHEVPQELHSLIVTSACLAVKVAHDSSVSKENIPGDHKYTTFGKLPTLFS